MAAGSRRRRTEEVVPSAARTIASLRDVGYDVPRAIADLVDNSIGADATRVDIALHFNGADSWIRISDNGTGMNAATLQEAMRYGSERDYEADDLGKFGFGLKTASTSQCRRLIVCSRAAKQYARFEVRSLDLAHIEKTNRWEILVLEGADRPKHATEPLKTHRGTVVLWEDLDRILEYQDPFGEWARKKMLSLAEEIDLHLGMIFHRFLAGEVPGKKLAITVNGSKVLPWDPFCREEPKTEEIPARDLPVVGHQGVGIVRLRPYIVPNQSEFSNDAAWRRASGPAKWNRQQGFYIYRANRMIQSGGWNRMRTTDEHTKLARVAVEFFPDLDSVFGIDIAKAYVTLPQELREQLEPIVAQTARRAEQRYRSGQKSGSVGTGGSGRGARGGASGSGGSAGGGSAGTKVASASVIEEVAAGIGEAEALRRIVRALKKSHAEVARDIGW